MDVIIIPAYNPDDKLLELVTELFDKGFNHIIVVNDGSLEDTKQIFTKVSAFAIVLNHKINQGKGMAIKTALHYIENNKLNTEGMVLMDADGQHKVEDAIRLLEEVHKHKSALVLGVRQLDRKIPLRSLFGNTITKYVFRLFSGKWVSDTQTGLRAFTKDMVPILLEIRGERYEYEMNVLITCAKNNTLIKEVPISTIYHDKNNSCSHFRTIRDSARIYRNLFAFSGASFISFLLDYVLFFILSQILEFGFSTQTTIILANVLARVMSAAFNYYINSTYIFQYKQNRLKSIMSYGALACIILVLNTVILYCLYDYLGLNKALAKLITELLLFIISFTFQKFVIFNHPKMKGAKNI